MKNNDWKDRLNVVYSTNPDFGYEMDNDEEQVTLDKDKQNLRVSIDKKNRGGKVVTLITGFVGTENDLKELGKLLKSKCGVGGSAKDGEIIIQGDFKTKVMELLVREGYTKTKRYRRLTYLKDIRNEESYFILCSSVILTAVVCTERQRGYSQNRRQDACFHPYFDRQRNSKFRRLERESSNSLISLPLGAVLARVNWQKFRKPFGPNIKTTRISA